MLRIHFPIIWKCRTSVSYSNCTIQYSKTFGN